MQNGLYQVHFKTPLGEGVGVACLRDGKLHGGDGGFFYIGSYSLNDTVFIADVQMGRHELRGDRRSVFGVDSARIKLQGTYSSTSADLKGTAVQIPGITFKALLRWLSG